ncbi:unnamed protein product [Caenorhabditis brenneri]
MRAFSLFVLLAFLGVLSATIEHEMKLVGNHEITDRQLTAIRNAARDPRLIEDLNKLIYVWPSWRWNVSNPGVVRRTIATLGHSVLDQRVTVVTTYVFGQFWFKVGDYAGQLHEFTFKENYASPTNYTLWDYKAIKGENEPGKVLCDFQRVIKFIFGYEPLPRLD